MPHDPADDDRAIRNLIATMAMVTDGGDLETYGSLLAEDAVWQMPGGEPVHGRDAIVESARTRRAAGVLGPGSDTRHHVSTIVVHVDGDTASSQACWQFWGNASSGPVLRAIGRYEDTFRRTPEGWKYTSRKGIPG